MSAETLVTDNAAFDAETEGAKRVEIKVTVARDEEPIAIKALSLDMAKAEGRNIYFFDTPQLDLYKAGVVLRAREIEGAADDSTVKIRPVDPHTLDPAWSRIEGFKVEADAVGEKVVLSASFTAEQGKDEIQQVCWKKRPISKLFSPDQERFLATHYPKALNLDALAILGPIPALRQDIEHSSMTYKFCVEAWRLPDASNLVELSIKCARKEAAVARKVFEGFIAGLGVNPHGSQESKTKRALTFFAGRLAGP